MKGQAKAVGTEMAANILKKWIYQKNLLKRSVIVAKFITKQQKKTIKKFESIKKNLSSCCAQLWNKRWDYKRLNEILKEYSFFEFICIDIANGYSDHFSKFKSRKNRLAKLKSNKNYEIIWDT